jgi:hypothetical protein
MIDQNSRNKEFKSIKIGIPLYKRLRKHCDQNAIRFKDFVEDSLENAIHIDESIKMYRVEIEKLKKKATSYDYAFRRGFEKGLYFLFLAFQGRFDNNLEKDDIESLKNRIYKASKGTQITIFEKNK